MVIYPKMTDLIFSKTSPYTYVDVDYAAPFIMKEIYMHDVRQYNVYLVVFIYISVKTIHLEAVLD